MSFHKKLGSFLLGLAVAVGSVVFGQVPISGLPPATLPLSGNEKVVMTQSGVTKQASVNSILAGAPPTPPGGLDMNVQYNFGGTSFGGSPNFSFNYNTNFLNLLGADSASLGSSSPIVANPGSSPATYNVGFAAQADIGLLSTVPFGVGNQSFNAFAAKNTNSAGYTALVLANDSYLGSSFTSFPNAAGCCNIPNGPHSAVLVWQGTTVAPGQVFSAMPAGEGLYIGTMGTSPYCMGTFNHCIMLMDGTFGTVNFGSSTGSHTGPDFQIRGGNTGTIQPTLQVLGENTAGISTGIQIQAGLNSSDYTFQALNQAGQPGMQLAGDGSGFVGSSASANLSRKLTWGADGSFVFHGQGVGSTNPAVTIQAGAQINQPLLVVSELGAGFTSNTFTAKIQAATGAAGFQSGLYVGGGTNSSDTAIQVQNAAETINFLNILGDGSGTLGPNGTNNLSWTANGNFSFNTPISGTALTVHAISNARAIDVSDGTSTFDLSTSAAHNWFLGPVDAHDFSIQTGTIGTSRILISGTTGAVTVAAPTGGSAITLADGSIVNRLSIGQAGGNGSVVQFLGSSAGQGKNWLVGNQFNLSDTFEITPSTANGGSTFTTPAVKIPGATSELIGQFGISAQNARPSVSSGTSQLTIGADAGGVGQVIWIDSAGAADAKVWDMFSDASNQFHARALNDAINSTTEWLTVTRSGLTISTVNFPNGTLQSGGTAVCLLNGTNCPAGAVLLKSLSGGLNASTLAVGGTAWAGKSAATNRNTTATAANDPDLAITNVPAGTYKIHSFILFACANTTMGMQFNFNTSGTTATANNYGGVFGYQGGTVSAPTNTPAVATTQTGVLQTVTAASCGANTNSMQLDGEFTTTGSGTFAFSWSQQTSNGSNLTVGQSSFIELLRVN